VSTVALRTRILGGAALAVAVAAAALLAVRAARPAPPLRLVVAAVRQPATSLFFVAQASGCLAAERLEVEEHDFDLGRDALGLRFLRFKMGESLGRSSPEGEAALARGQTS
jgi:NitT/TauT family transport system substrate-binding protein